MKNSEPDREAMSGPERMEYVMVHEVVPALDKRIAQQQRLIREVNAMLGREERNHE